MQTNFGTLKDSADRNREGFAAIFALVEAGAVSLAFQFVMLTYHATVRAYGTVRPYLRFEVSPGFIGVLKVWCVKIRHDNLPKMALV